MWRIARETQEGGDVGEADWRGLDRRRGTERKTVRLTPEFRERVQAWADQQGVSFSSALETLALLGMGDAPQLAVMPMVIFAMREEVQRQANRLASLSVTAAVESAVTTRLVSNLILERERSRDPERGRERYEAIRNRARLQAVQAVRKRDGLEELLDGRVREGQVPAGQGRDGEEPR